jgi:hypothetical protein
MANSSVQDSYDHRPFHVSRPHQRCEQRAAIDHMARFQCIFIRSIYALRLQPRRREPDVICDWPHETIEVLNHRLPQILLVDAIESERDLAHGQFPR